MSYYETPEERRHREMMSRMNSLERQNRTASTENRNLRSQLDNLRRQREKENQQMAQRMEQQRREQQAAMNETVRDLNAEISQREALLNQRIAHMQQQHTQEVNNLNQRMQAEREGLRSEVAQTRAEMRERIGTLRRETDNKLWEQRQEAQRSISQLDARLTGDISRVDQKLDALARQIQSRQNGSRDLARYWQQEGERLVAQLEEKDPHHLVDPSKIRRDLNDARQYMESGNYQAAMVAGRTAFNNAMDMREELAAAELEWNFWYNSLQSRRSQLLENLNSAEHRAYQVEINGRSVEYDDLNYWTHDQLAITSRRIAEQCAQLDQVGSWDLARIQEAEQALQQLQAELDLLENAGQSNVAMMVSRFDTARQIGEILGDQYHMVDADGDFFARENREEYHAIFENPVTGARAAVVITPLTDENGVDTNHVEVIVDNGDNNSGNRDRMVQSIQSSLSSRTGERYTFPCAQRYGDRTLEEVDRVGDIEAVRTGSRAVRGSAPEGREREPAVQVTRTTKN